MKKLISLFTVFLMICSFTFTAVADGDTTAITQKIYEAVRFKTDGENSERALGKVSERSSITLKVEGLINGTWEDITIDSAQEDYVEFRALFNIINVDQNGKVTRAFDNGGNGVAPVLVAYKNADGTIVSAKTSMILHDRSQSQLQSKVFGDYTALSYYDSIKATDTNLAFRSYQPLDSYKYAICEDANGQNYRTGASLNKNAVLEYWFYDTGISGVNAVIEDAVNSDNRNIKLAIQSSTTSTGTYSVYDAISDVSKSTPVTKSEGWHQITVMLSGGSTNGGKDANGDSVAQNHVVAYLDGECIFDKATQVKEDHFWVTAGRTSGEEAKTYYSKAYHYQLFSTDGQNVPTIVPVVLDSEIVSMVKVNETGNYYGLRLKPNETFDGYNPKNLSYNNLKVSAFYNYYMPGYPQTSGDMRIYDRTNAGGVDVGTTTAPTSYNDGPAYGGQIVNFLSNQNSSKISDGYSTKRFDIFINSNAGTKRNIQTYINYSSETTDPNQGRSKLRYSQPLLYGQDTTTGYYHDITNDGVIGYNKVKAGVRYMNHYDDEPDVMVSIAQYEDGKLVDVYTENTKFTTGTIKDIVHEFDVGDSTKTEFKTFIWRTASYKEDNSVFAYLLRPYEDNNNTKAEAYTFGPFGRK